MEKIYPSISLSLLIIFALLFPIQARAGELHDAATKGDISKVRQLLEQGANVNAPDNFGTTPLHYAARFGNTDVAKLLIEKGADVNARDNTQWTPLYEAAICGNTDVVKLLIEKGADVNAKDKGQDTPLHKVASGGNTDVAKLLIERGADVNARAAYQKTPLHTAAYYGKTDVAKLLIERGADINARDNLMQKTPLHTAISEGKTDVAKLLIERGADVNARDQYQSIPLHEAATRGNTDVAKLLIEKGADVNAKDYHNYTPAVVAEENKHPELAAMIRKQGGKGSARQGDFDALVQKGYRDVYDVEAIIRMARTLNPPPAVPQEARDEMVKGMAAFKMAKRPEDFKGAEDHFNKASHLAPWIPEPYFNLALAQEKLALARGQQNKFFDAKSSIEKYLIAVTDPKDTQAGKQKMAELELQLKRYHEFRNEANAGVYYYQKGPNGYNDAIKHWRKAIEIYPDHPEADIVYNNLGEVYMNQGDLDAAYKYMQKSFELVPEPSDMPARYTNMGVVLERRGDRAKACVYYKKGCDNGSKVSCGNLSNCP